MAAAYDREAWSRRANEIRARLPVSKVVGQVVALKKQGAELLGLCPFHDEKTPSFTVNDRKRFFHCFGCGQHGDAIGFVMARQGLDFRAAVELLESENGLSHLHQARPAPPAPRAPQREDLQKADKVRRIWERATPVTSGDPVDLYLRGRCMAPPAEYGFGGADANAGWPSSLRFAAALWHGIEKREMPAMVAAMRKPDGTLAAVHRTYLRVTGLGVTKAGTASDKRMFGDPKGAFILLAPIGARMLGGEGIETTLAAMQLFGRAGLAFGTAGNMRFVEPPFECGDFLYAADRNAKSRVGEKAAWAAAHAFGHGRRVTVKIPAIASRETCDFNDVLVERQRLAALSPFQRALESQKVRGIHHEPMRLP